MTSSTFVTQIREIMASRPKQTAASGIDSFNLSRKQTFLARLRPNAEQWRHLTAFTVMLAAIVVAYCFSATRLLLYPFELISTVFHEFGHAFMTVMTGGRVTAIEINPDESGVTRFVGGSPCLILPAGYIGSSVAGAVLLILSFGQKSSRFAAGGTALILLATLYWAGSIFTVFSAIAMIGALLAVIVKGDQWLQMVVLFMGTMGSATAMLSISSHLISHRIDGSDAVQFAKHCSFLIPSSVFGVLWFVISGLVIVGSILSALVIYK